MHTVAVFFVVAEGVRRSGLLAKSVVWLFGRPNGPSAAIARLMVPAATISAFMNNTPLVAILMPAVRTWCGRIGLAPSQLLIPLSYAAILGGMCTTIGTSTNLVVAGMVTAAGHGAPGFFSVGAVGLPAAIAGMLATALLGRYLLPRRPGTTALADPRAFTAEVEVEAGGALDGRRLDEIRTGGSRQLSPVEIDRADATIPAPLGGEVLRGGDILVFAGGADEIRELLRAPGLRVARTQQFTGNAPERRRRQIELVIGERCPLVGEMVGDGSFRQQYNAAVIAVARHGERVPRAGLKGWLLKAGDIVLVEAAPGFVAQHRYNTDFYIIGDTPEQQPVRPWQSWASFALLAGIVTAAGTGLLPTYAAALGGALAMIGLRIVRWGDALSALDGRVLLTIAAALGLGSALESSGAAGFVAGALAGLAGDGPLATLAAVYLATMLITEVVTNNAAAVLMTPVALAAAGRLGVNYEPFVYAVMIAASASFLTPIGYQTNLMVYGPGNYRFADYFRAGLPVSVAVATVTILLAPVFWPFVAR
jgi:di/tricarboxylate transporter